MVHISVIDWVGGIILHQLSTEDRLMDDWHCETPNVIQSSVCDCRCMVNILWGLLSQQFGIWMCYTTMYEEIVAPSISNSFSNTTKFMLLTYLQTCVYYNSVYRIHSNKRPGCLDKSFWVGTYWFQYCWKVRPKKWMIFALFRLIHSHTEVGM